LIDRERESFHPLRVSAYTERNGVPAAYKRAARIAERMRLMRIQAGFLGFLAAGAAVIPLRANATK
jgi:hypothetical protein